MRRIEVFKLFCLERGSLHLRLQKPQISAACLEPRGRFSHFRFQSPTVITHFTDPERIVACLKPFAPGIELIRDLGRGKYIFIYSLFTIAGSSHTWVQWNTRREKQTIIHAKNSRWESCAVSDLFCMIHREAALLDTQPLRSKSLGSCCNYYYHHDQYWLLKRLSGR